MTPQQLRLLAGLLAMPEKESLAVLEELAVQNNWLSEPVQELKGISLGRWQAEHTQLFINGYPKTPCPPFESVYRHEMMNGPACSELESLYQSIGLEPIEGVPADYLGMMLECAAFLLELPPSSEAEEASNEPSVETKETAKTHFQTLWQTHLAKWVPKFANDLQQHSQLRLYQQLGLKLQALF